MRKLIIASAVILVAGGVSLAGLRLQQDSGDNSGGFGGTVSQVADARVRFDAAVARAQEAESSATTIKVTYSSESEDEDDMVGDLTIARRGDHYLFTGLQPIDGRTAVFAFGRDDAGWYFCVAAQDDDGFWLGMWGQEAECLDDEEGSTEGAGEDEDAQDFLDFFTGGVKIEQFISVFEPDVQVSDADPRTVAGLESECFRLKDSKTDMVVCLSQERGVLTLAEGSDEGEYVKLELTDISEEVSDADLGRPTFENAGTLPTVPITAWLGSPDARCSVPGRMVNATALAVDGSGDVWLGGFGQLLVLTPATCAVRSMPTDYPWDGKSWSGLAVGGDGTVYAAIYDGRLVEIGPDGHVAELLGEVGEQEWGSRTIGPAAFSDGSVAFGRLEAESLVVYRAVPGSVTIVRRWDEVPLLWGELVAVPRLGVALQDPTTFAELRLTSDGAFETTEIGTVSLWGCGAYSSATTRWEMNKRALVRLTADGGIKRFNVGLPEGAGCDAVVVDPEGDLWVLSQTVGAIFEVDLP